MRYPTAARIKTSVKLSIKTVFKHFSDHHLKHIFQVIKFLDFISNGWYNIRRYKLLLVIYERSKLICLKYHITSDQTEDTIIGRDEN